MRLPATVLLVWLAVLWGLMVSLGIGPAASCATVDEAVGVDAHMLQPGMGWVPWWKASQCVWSTWISCCHSESWHERESDQWRY